jgi:predicted  nucleic acid-binding Zn-ribbon protein
MEAMDIAQKQMEAQLQGQLEIMKQKKRKLEDFIETVKGRKEETKTASEKAQQDLKNKFDQVLIICIHIGAHFVPIDSQIVGRKGRRTENISPKIGS